MWLQSGIPASVCADHPEVAKSGIYRRLNDDACRKQGKPVPCYEFLSYCHPNSKRFLSIIDTEFNELLDKYIGPEKQKR